MFIILAVASVMCGGGPKEMDEFISHLFIRWLQTQDVNLYVCDSEEWLQENASMSDLHWTVAVAMGTTLLLAMPLVLAFFLLKCCDVEMKTGRKQAGNF